MSEVLKPTTAAQLRDVIAWAAAEEASLDVRGHGTRRALGRPMQTSRTLDLSALAGIVSYEPEELVLTARAGTPMVEIDAVLRGFLSLWPKGRPGQALRVGTAELLFLETPPHAAVHGAVETLPPDQSRARGLVNAVLRRVANEGKSVTAAQDAARLNTPGWLWQSWTAAYGEAAARAIAQAHLQEAPLDISVQSDVHGWANILEAEVLPTGSLRRMAPGAVDTLPGYAEGGWWIQDAAAALPARLLGDLQHRTVADLCAAPGGKTMMPVGLLMRCARSCSLSTDPASI